MPPNNALTEADRDALVAKGWYVSKVEAAYQLGIERGKAEREKHEFICDRCHFRQDSKLNPEESPF